MAHIMYTLDILDEPQRHGLTGYEQLIEEDSVETPNGDLLTLFRVYDEEVGFLGILYVLDTGRVYYIKLTEYNFTIH